MNADVSVGDRVQEPHKKHPSTSSSTPLPMHLLIALILQARLTTVSMHDKQLIDPATHLSNLFTHLLTHLFLPPFYYPSIQLSNRAGIHTASHPSNLATTQTTNHPFMQLSIHPSIRPVIYPSIRSIFYIEGIQSPCFAPHTLTPNPHPQHPPALPY